MEKVVVLLVSLSFGLAIAGMSQECKKLFTSYKHPYVCCKYPMRKVLPAHEENCKAKCSEEINKCCELDCIYRETGVVVDGVFYDHALVKLYENYLEGAGAGKYDKWMAVIEKSMRKCIDLIPKSMKILSCKVPEYVINITNCLNLMNYLDCPTFERTAECEAARSFVKSLDKCGKEVNGTVLPDHQYWDFQLFDPLKKKFV